MLESIWVFEGPDYIAFPNADLILPSLEITYSTVKAKIKQAVDKPMLKEYTISRPGVSNTILRFRLYQIYTEPTHL